MSTAYVTWKPLLQRRLQDLSRSQVLTTRILKGKYDIQVRLSRATLEFQVLQVPTGLKVKVFNSQVIYLISLTKILGQRSLVSKTFRFQKKLSFNEFWTQEIVSHRFGETNNEKTIQQSSNLLDLSY